MLGDKLLGYIYKILAIILMGFAGGAISPWVLGWLEGIKQPNVSDAVAIANTYIVFTTIIFVGITVILAIVGYVFTQQFSTTKEDQLNQLIYELKKKIQSDGKVGDEIIGIALANAILDNGDVKRHLEEKLDNKVNELIKNRLAESKTTAIRATEEVDAISKLNSQINGE